MGRLLCHLVVAALVLFLASQSLAQDNAHKGLEAYKQGVTLFKEGRIREAIKKFNLAQALHAHPNNQYYLGECHRRLGQLRASHEFYLKYAATLPAAKQKEFAVKLEKLRWEAPCMLSVASVPGRAEVTLDGAAKGHTPGDGSPLRLEVKGGRHTVTVKLDGHRGGSKEVVAEFGEAQALSFALVPLERPKAPPGPKVVRPVPRAPAPRRARAGGVFVALVGGPSWADYGLGMEVGAALEMGLRAGYVWRRGRLALEAGGTLLGLPVGDPGQDDTLVYLCVLGGGGLRFHLWRDVWAGVHISAGLAMLAGLDEHSFVFERRSGMEVSGAVFSSFMFRPEVSVGWRIWRGLSLLLVPVALDYTFPAADFTDDIKQIIRVHVALGTQWQW